MAGAQKQEFGLSRSCRVGARGANLLPQEDRQPVFVLCGSTEGSMDRPWSGLSWEPPPSLPRERGRDAAVGGES